MGEIESSCTAYVAKNGGVLYDEGSVFHMVAWMYDRDYVACRKVVDVVFQQRLKWVMFKILVRCNVVMPT
jgi:hypothetical protein